MCSKTAPSLPPDLAAITRKALAAQPVDRFASAASMADALETSQTAAGAARAAGTGPAGSGDRAAPAAGAGLAASAGVARSNPTMVAYPQDAYAGADEAPVRRGPDRAPRRTRAVNEDDEEGGTSPVVWLSGLAAILLLAGIGFVVYQLLSGPAEPAPAEQVAVPEFVGTLLADATQEADSAGLVLEVTEQPSDQPVGIIIDQDPPATTMVEVGSTVNVTVASGLEQVAMPDLRNRTEAQAVQEIVTAGLVPGIKTEAFDPVVAIGLVVTQSPAPGVVVAKGSGVDYVISKGPEPTPSPSPTPTPTPPPPTPPPPTPPPPTPPPPTPTPPPPPTPTPEITPEPPPEPS